MEIFLFIEIFLRARQRDPQRALQSLDGIIDQALYLKEELKLLTKSSTRLWVYACDHLQARQLRDELHLPSMVSILPENLLTDLKCDLDMLIAQHKLGESLTKLVMTVVKKVGTNSLAFNQWMFVLAIDLSDRSSAIFGVFLELLPGENVNEWTFFEKMRGMMFLGRYRFNLLKCLNFLESATNVEGQRRQEDVEFVTRALNNRLCILEEYLERLPPLRRIARTRRNNPSSDEAMIPIRSCGT